MISSFKMACRRSRGSRRRPGKLPEQIRAAILKEAEKDDVPIDAKDIKVQAVNGNVKIKVDYSVTVDLTVYQWTLNFHPKVSNDSLT